jgi:hypothetical protein
MDPPRATKQPDTEEAVQGEPSGVTTLTAEPALGPTPDTDREPFEPLEPEPEAPGDGVGLGALAPGRDTQRVLAAICPYLLAEDGSWRAARPLREHRCSAVRPPATLPLNKQRRLCLVDAHRTCPAFQAAQERRATELAAAGITLGALAARQSRPLARTVPTALDRPSAVPGSASLVANYRRLVQVGLAGLMLLAAGLLILARFSGGSTGPPATPSATPSAPAVIATETPSPSQTTGAESAAPTAEATATPRPSATRRPRRTYVVQPGDSLSSIAEHFGTTVERLVQLNDIEDPSYIRPGDELIIR